MIWPARRLKQQPGMTGLAGRPRKPRLSRFWLAKR
jgi:hypothetical protein